MVDTGNGRGQRAGRAVLPFLPAILVLIQPLFHATIVRPSDTGVGTFP